MTFYTVNLPIRLAIMASCVVAIIAFYLWGKRTGRKPEALAAILWLINVLTFHIARISGMNVLSVEFFNNWSLGIHLHAALGCAIAGVLLARARKL